MNPFSKMSVVAATGVAALCISGSVLLYLRDRFKKRNAKKQGMKLYVYPQFRSCRCVWLANELGILNEIECIEFNPQDPDSKTVERYRKNVHPHGTIPALAVEGTESIIESGAICLYLADLYQKFLPPSGARHDYYNWAMYTSVTLDETMEHLYTQWILTEPDKQDQNLIKRMVDKFEQFAEHFSKHIENKIYICGDTFTAVDCIMGYNLWCATGMADGSLLKNHPEIFAYYQRLQSRSAFQQTFTSEFLNFDF